MSSATITVYRDGFACAECGEMLGRTGFCIHDSEHRGTAPYEEVEEIEVELSAHVTPYVPARTHGDPDDCYPAEGGEVEDLKATVDGKPFELSDDEYGKAVDAIRDAVGSYEDDYDGPDPDDFRDDDICDQYYDPY